MWAFIAPHVMVTVFAAAAAALPGLPHYDLSDGLGLALREVVEMAGLGGLGGLAGCVGEWRRAVKVVLVR